MVCRGPVQVTVHELGKTWIPCRKPSSKPPVAVCTVVVAPDSREVGKLEEAVSPARISEESRGFNAITGSVSDVPPFMYDRNMGEKFPKFRALKPANHGSPQNIRGFVQLATFVPPESVF